MTELYSRLGTEFLVNTATLYNQSQPTITSLASGELVVSWTDPSGQGGDASGTSMKAQIFEPVGSTITGTNGNDTLTGTNSDDVINPLLGRDTVDGGAGSDTLNVNYAAATTGTNAANVDQWIRSNGFGGYDGTIKSSSGNDSVGFSNIEHLNYIGDAGSSRVIADIFYQGGASSLTIDGGAGNDQMIVLGQSDNFNFTRSNGVATSTGNATYSNFESYRVDTRGGYNTVSFDAGSNRVNTSAGGHTTILGGSGGDSVASNAIGGAIGAIDTFDGGGGLDQWDGYYGQVASNLTFNYNGSSGSLSNGTSLQSVERVLLETGSGDDTFTLQASPGSFNLFGGAGYDVVALDFTAETQDFELVTGGSLGTTSGNVLDGFESVSITGGSGNDRIGGLFSTTNSLDGRGGFDTAVVDASDQLTGAFSGGLDASVIYDATTAKSLSIANFEVLEFTGNVATGERISGGSGNDKLTGLTGNDTFYGQGGDDTISGGGGNDVLYGGEGRNTLSGGEGADAIFSEGVDTVDGGNGKDSWSANFSSSTANLTVNLVGTGAVVSIGARAVNVENVILSSGSGDDTITTDARSDNQQVDGRAGFDTLLLNAAGTPGLSGGVIFEGTGGFSVGLAGPQTSVNFNNFESADLALGDGDNAVFVNLPTSMIVAGASLTIDGGFGSDKITLGGLHTGYAFTDLGLGLQRVTDSDASDGTQLSFTIRNVEFFGFDDGIFAAPVPTIGGTYIGTSGDNVLSGSAYYDTLTGLAGNDTLNGGSGNDLLNGGAGDDKLTGGDGIDTATYVDATKGVQVNLALTTAQVTGDGKDTLSGIENITGSAFVDSLRGDGNANVLDGGAGNDKLFGFGGSDTLIGGTGNDTLDGGTGSDVMTGGVGNDTYIVDNIGDEVHENPGEGIDTVKASVTYAIIATDVEKLIQTGTDNIDAYGNNLANTLSGNAGNNLLFGDAGKDVLSGGAGNDTLIGGAGADILTGGSGNDRFVFDSLTVSADKDTIKDFVSGQDKLSIDRSVFAAFASDLPGALSASAFTFGTMATTLDQHLIYNSATGALFYDADGSGAQAQVQIALLTAHPLLVASDFLLG